jgi:hypothetical protein
MMQVRLSGTLAIDTVDVLVELSAVPREGMTELKAEDAGDKWRVRRLKRYLNEYGGGRVFYRTHPEMADFLGGVWFPRTYKENEHWLHVCCMRDCASIAELVVESTWSKSNATFGSYFEGKGGWAILSSLPPESTLMPVILSGHFDGFRTNVMGLTKRRVREITKAMLDAHYIHFTMRDGKGNYNSLKALVPRIEKVLKEPRFPTAEIEELCGDDV